MTVRRWLSTFAAVVLAGASILLAVWAVALIVSPAELIHWDVAIPLLVLSGIGAMTACVLWRRG